MNFTRAYWSKTYLKPSNKLTFYKILFSLQLLLFFGSCNKTDFYLEGNAPEDPYIVRTDTESVSLKTDLHQRLRTDNLSYDLLGTFMDPVFGRTSANVYAQVRLSDRNPSFTSSSAFDSVVLYVWLQKNTFIGNFADAQTFKVYSLVNKIESSTIYYSDTTFPVSADPIGTFTGKFSPNDTLLKIKLTDAFKEKFKAADKSVFADNGSFSDFLKGIAIIPDSTGLASGKGAIITADLANDKSGMILYYDTTKTFKMAFGAGIRVNTYSHNFTGTPAGKALSNQSNFPSRAYMQSMAGLRTIVTFPEIKKRVKDSALALYKAELILTRIDSSADINNKYFPLLLYMLPRNSAGTSTFFRISGQSSEVNYNTDQKAYKIDITRYIQNLLTSYSNNQDFDTYGLNLTIPIDNPLAPTRTILDAAQNSGNRPKLILTYTKLVK